MNRYLVPLGIFAALVAVLGIGLSLNPRLVPSPLVGKPAPEFRLPTVKSPEKTLGNSDLLGQVSLLNVWATWCVSCRAEHDMLLAIARSREVPIYGLNYKDNREDAIRWLRQLGDPYVANAYDVDGRIGLEFGVYGAPETFIIDKKGMIAYKHVGPITPEVWERKLLPLVRELRSTEG